MSTSMRVKMAMGSGCKSAFDVRRKSNGDANADATGRSGAAQATTSGRRRLSLGMMTMG
eukprot:CAMPEP_0198239450 /NCGR_PEP_ID=MMETSP1446-20131203/4849_1 /TAXON_ID=1461542 ORGANISM="Unidentified sp, Strain CCMP2111" /NCGR_SAMPLE_ID=MMETSP1446 /ASSEMBLY_ACC=CAM_ASM_001112 /LENGTH=58 /DNA_ID=CAMNT_0043922037 /DNA_START=9 /DNA_END=182 /DNA_ORIENTATION=-